MKIKDQILDLLIQWEEQQQLGQPVQLAELTGGNQKLEAELKQHIQRLGKTSWLSREEIAEDEQLDLPSKEVLKQSLILPDGLKLDQLISNIKKSKLIEVKDLEKLLEQRKISSVYQLVNALLETETLTRFQLRAVAHGKTKGLTLGKYVILDKIGEGGMGAVFKARHSRMDRIVALKVLPRESKKNKAAIARFLQEAQTAAQLSHPNIVAAYDSDDAEGYQFLVLEYVEGQDLSDRVKRSGTLPTSEAIDALIQAARGLEYSHDKGIIHRDIKPANLLIDNQGTVKVLDMGLARFVNPNTDKSGLTQDGAVMGTVDYMPPEQAISTKTVDRRADLYSLGCTLHYLLTGRPPFEGETMLVTMLGHREQKPSNLSHLRKDVPPELDDIFQKLMAKLPENRYQTATELITALEAIQPLVKSLEAAVGTETLAPITLQSDIETSGTNLAQTEPGLFQALSIPQKSIALQAKEKFKPLSLPQKVGGGIAVALCLLGFIYLLSGFVFRIDTPSGQLVIDVTGDDFETHIKGQKVKITNTKTSEEYTITLDDPKTIEPLGNGTYQFEVETSSGLKFQQDKFKIAQGVDSKVSVHWVPKDNGTPLATNDTNGSPTNATDLIATTNHNTGKNLIDNSQIANGLVAYYPFNGNANDESGHGNNPKAFFATRTTDRFDNKSSAYYFNGSAKLESKLLSLPQKNEPRTVSLWVKRNLDYKDNRSSVEVLVQWGEPVPGKSFAVFLLNDSLATSTFGPKSDIAGKNELKNDEWHHVSAVFNDTRLSLFLDGTLVAEKNNVVCDTTLSPLYFGVGLSDAYWFNGKLDDVRIYNRGLSSDEIRAIYDLEMSARTTSKNPRVAVRKGELPKYTEGALKLDASTTGKWVHLLENEEQLNQWTQWKVKPTRTNKLPAKLLATIKDGITTLDATDMEPRAMEREISTDATRFIVHVRQNLVSGYNTSNRINLGLQVRMASLFSPSKHELWVSDNPNTAVMSPVSLQSPNGFGDFADSDFVVIDGHWTAYTNGQEIGSYPGTKAPLTSIELGSRNALVQWKDVAVMRLSDAQVEAIGRGELPKYPANQEPSPTTGNPQATDRQVAEHVQQREGLAWVGSSRSEKIEWRSLKDGLPREPFKLLGIYFNQIPLTDKDFELFGQASELDFLDLRHCGITDAELAAIGQFKNLAHLEVIDFTKNDQIVTGQGMALIKDLSKLETLNFPLVTDSGLKIISDLTQLKSLSIYRSEVTAEGLKPIEKLKNLEILEIRNSTLSSAHLATISELTNLRELVVVEGVQLQGLVHLENMRSLENLRIAPCPIGDTDLVHFKELTELKELDLLGTNVTGKGFATLSGLHKLRRLHLANSQFTDEGLEQLGLFSELTYVSLDGTQVTDAGLKHLVKLKQLLDITLRDTRVTDNGLKILTGNPNIQSLSLGPAVTDASVEHLKQFPKLTYADLRNTQITPAGVAELRKAFPSCRINHEKNSSPEQEGYLPFAQDRLAPVKPIWTSLFNGKDLKYWEVEGGAGWSVQDGELIGKATGSRLVTSWRDFENVEVRVECKLARGVNSGVYVRTTHGDGPESGYEAQLSNVIGYPTLTGGIYDYTEVKKQVIPDNQWFELRFRIDENQMMVFVNGVQTSAISVPASGPNTGAIALQCFNNKEVRFRKVEVRQLDSQSAKPTTGNANTTRSSTAKSSSLGGKWVELFNGKNLTGWTQKNGTATYRVADGTILGTSSNGSPNSFLCSNKEYGDFELEFEVKVDNDFNSGVQIRSKVLNAQGKVGRVSGPQIEVESGPGVAGYLYGEATGRSWLRPRNQLVDHNHFKNKAWNKYRIVAKGSRIQTWINGEIIEDLTDEEIFRLYPKGFVGLQVHGVKNQAPLNVQWRNIRIMELGNETVNPLNNNNQSASPLFNKTSLRGWKIQGSRGGWSINNGIITGESTTSKGVLLSDTEYDNYHLQFDYKLSVGGNSGIFLRAPLRAFDSTGQMLEVQLLDNDYSKYKKLGLDNCSGALHGMVPAIKKITNPAGTWHTMDILAHDKQLTVKIDDELVLDTLLTDKVIAKRQFASNTKGRIGFQLWPDTKIEIRDAKLSVMDENANLQSLTDTPKPPPNPGSFHNTVGMKLVKIPAGTFLMGSSKSAVDLSKQFDSIPEDFTNELPQHRVKLTNGFYMGSTEVTQGQWNAIMGATPRPKEFFIKEGVNFAASYISWGDATEFCRKLSLKEGRTYRLPTEAEWEYACRGGSTTMYYFGQADKNDLADHAWYNENAYKIGNLFAHPVGLKKANSYGLHDMHGNLWEWCSDWYEADYYTNSPSVDPVGPASGSMRVSRGGSWVHFLEHGRSADRDWSIPGKQSKARGFRVVCEEQIPH